METETTLDTLVATEAIKRLKARYFRCMDQRDWQGFGAAFAPDATLTVDSLKRDERGEPIGMRSETGREAIVAWVSGVLAGATTIHHGHMPEIEITSADEASGVWAMVDRVIWSDRWLRGWGHYTETYRRVGGQWLIASSRLSRLHVEMSGGSVGSGARMLDENIAAEAQG